MSDLPPDDLDLPEEEDEEAFPASQNTPGQRASRDSFARLQEKIEELIARKEAPGWREEYLDLRAEGWDWRKAAFIAWSASPTKVITDGVELERWPATQERLAVDVLGLKSDRVIAKWKKKYPELQLRIEQQAAAPYVKHARDLAEVNLKLALTPDPATFNDRKLAMIKAGLYQERTRQEISGPNGGPVESETRLAQVVIMIPDNGREDR